MDVVAANLEHIGAAREYVGDFSVAEAQSVLLFETDLERIFDCSIADFSLRTKQESNRSGL